MRGRAARLAALVAVAGLVLGLAACDPPAGSGLAVRALGPTTGLEPGAVVPVRVAGVAPGRTVTLQQCAGDGPCLNGTTRTARADAEGAVTVAWSVEGAADATPVDWIWGSSRREGCRPPTTCTITAWSSTTPDGYPADARRVALGLTGHQVTFSVTPTTGLRAGTTVTVTGRVAGAEGRRVRLARAERVLPRNEAGVTKVGGSTWATVRADGTFRGTYTMPADPDCGNGDFSVCVFTAWVQKADGSAIDPSFGKPTVDLSFA